MGKTQTKIKCWVGLQGPNPPLHVGIGSSLVASNTNTQQASSLCGNTRSGGSRSTVHSRDSQAQHGNSGCGPRERNTQANSSWTVTLTARVRLPGFVRETQ